MPRHEPLSVWQFPRPHGENNEEHPTTKAVQLFEIDEILFLNRLHPGISRKLMGDPRAYDAWYDPAAAAFCPDCGMELLSECPACNTPILAETQYTCPGCGANLNMGACPCDQAKNEIKFLFEKVKR